jgi:hypothetical protein
VFLYCRNGWPEFNLQDTIVLSNDTVSDQILLIDNPEVHLDTIISEVSVNDSSQVQISISSPINESISSQNEIPGSIDNLSLINAKLSDENIPYYIPDAFNIYQQNQSLRNFKNQYFTIKETSDLIFKKEVKPSDSLIHIESSQYLNKNNTINQDINPDWLIGIIIGLLIVLASLKLFFNKFFDQVLVALWNFQLGSKFLRDQGIFSRRVGLVLNINFILIFGLFIYLVLNHFNIYPFPLKPILVYLIYTSIIAIILLIRYILTVLAGLVFNQQTLFREYLYQILVIYKNLGIFFIPVVFCIAYIQENLRIYVIIFALVLIAMAYIFRFIKGFQIIIKKDIKIFYLILYLCTLEILPVLFYYKFFSGVI